MTVSVSTIKLKFEELVEEAGTLELTTQPEVTRVNVIDQLNLIKNFLIKHSKLITAVNTLSTTYLLITVKFEYGLTLEYAIDETPPIITVYTGKYSNQALSLLDNYLYRNILLERRNLLDLTFSNNTLDKVIPTYIKIKENKYI